ncbi:30S ribosomal protein S5 [Cocos nucifera]|uniref:30S ribosomal protein S5 n=1 Tax=Cocos nucifera TaxID=13894 RepID=A0A8K0IX52_COCNU|nr:30S ribosomal protein S5 [Cocos nucifera]
MSLGKLAIVIGAGLVGSALSKEGRLSDITGIFSGALKVITKHLQQDKDNSQSSGKPQTDTLLAQVNSLRQELQTLASSRSVTIVTGTSAGSGTYGVTAVIVIGVVGYGYVWWKGWKLSDVMFVTQRGLSNACTAVGKKLDLVSSSIADARRHLSSRIDRVDINLDECRDLTNATKGEVSRLNGELSGIHQDVESVHRFIQTLGTKISRIEESQDITTRGLYSLCMFVDSLDNRRDAEPTQVLPSSSRLAIEPPQTTPVTRNISLPPATLDSPSASASPSPSAAVESPKILRSSTAVSASGLKELQGFSNTVILGIPKSNSIKIGTSEASSGNPSVGEPSSSTSSSSRSGWKLPSFSVLTRTRGTAT